MRTTRKDKRGNARHLLRDPIKVHLRHLKRLAISIETLLKVCLDLQIVPIALLPRHLLLPIEPEQALQELITLANRDLPEEENAPSPLSVTALSPPSDSDWE